MVDVYIVHGGVGGRRRMYGKLGTIALMEPKFGVCWIDIVSVDFQFSNLF